MVVEGRDCDEAVAACLVEAGDCFDLLLTGSVGVGSEVLLLAVKAVVRGKVTRAVEAVGPASVPCCAVAGGATVLPLLFLRVTRNATLRA